MNTGRDGESLSFRAARKLRPIRVVADDRERIGGVVEALRAIERVEVEVRHLEVGDYVVEDRFLVERKTLRDFAQSIIDARLFRQTAALAGSGRRSLLVLEGTSRGLMDLGMSRESLQGALITVSVFFGLPVLRALDASETARLLLYLGRQAQAQADGGLPRAGYRPKGRRARQLFILQGLPGIGPDRAARLLQHFGSVQAILNASAAELAAVDSIGETTAERLRWAVEEHRVEWSSV